MAKNPFQDDTEAAAQGASGDDGVTGNAEGRAKSLPGKSAEKKGAGLPRKSNAPQVVSPPPSSTRRALPGKSGGSAPAGEGSVSSQFSSLPSSAGGGERGESAPERGGAFPSPGRSSSAGKGEGLPSPSRGASPLPGQGRRERPQVVLPPSSGVKRRPFLSEGERERLGDKPGGGKVVLPPSRLRGEEGVPPSGQGEEQGALPARGREGSSLPSTGRKGKVQQGEGEKSSSYAGRKDGQGEALPVSVPSSVDQGEGVRSLPVSVSSSVSDESEGERLPVKRKRAQKSAPAPRDEGLADVDESWGEGEEEEEPVEESYRDTVLDTSRARGIRIMERDVEILSFLGRYRYAQAAQVARLVATSDAASHIRLTKLETAGLVRRNRIAHGHAVWSPLKGGMAIADLDFPVVGSGRISLSTMGHELGLVNLGIELETGGQNVLREEGFPFYNKYPVEGSFDDVEMLLGENIFTTREIRSSQTRWSQGKTSSQVLAERDALMASWNPGERPPETLSENAGAFVLYSQDYKDHVPDMVVARDRDPATGRGQSIAIELELSAKPQDEWRRILKNYRGYIRDGLISSVFYFTQRTAIKDSLLKLNREEVGIPEESFRILRYVSRNKQLVWG